jgi:hypothetical protein
MKRSAQIGLVVMGALGATTAGGYYMVERNQACQSPSGRTNDQNCQRTGSSHSGSGHGSGRAFFGSTSSSPSSTGSPSPGTSSHPAGAQHGGFGSTGHAIGSHGTGS